MSVPQCSSKPTTTKPFTFYSEPSRATTLSSLASAFLRAFVLDLTKKAAGTVETMPATLSSSPLVAYVLCWVHTLGRSEPLFIAAAAHLKSTLVTDDGSGDEDPGERQTGQWHQHMTPRSGFSHML